MLLTKKHALPAIVVSVALCFSGVPAAQAASPESDRKDAAYIAEEVALAELIENVSATLAEDGGAEAEAGGGESAVVFPADQYGKVVFSNETGSSISIGLPNPAESNPARVESGRVSYDNGDGSHTVTSLNSDSSFTALSVIESADAPSQYTYEVNAGESGWLDLQEDGSVLVVGASGTPVGTVAPSWAVDANGNSVQTGYEVSGNLLTQWVDLSSPDIAFPVVADPTVYHEWWGTVVKLSRSETNYVATAGGSTAILNAACGYIPSPHVRVGCLALGIAKVANLVSTANAANNQGRCLAINVPAAYWAGPGGSYLGLNFANVVC